MLGQKVNISGSHFAENINRGSSPCKSADKFDDLAIPPRHLESACQKNFQHYSATAQILNRKALHGPMGSLFRTITAAIGLRTMISTHIYLGDNVHWTPSSSDPDSVSAAILNPRVNLAQPQCQPEILMAKTTHLIWSNSLLTKSKETQIQQIKGQV